MIRLNFRLRARFSPSTALAEHGPLVALRRTACRDRGMRSTTSSQRRMHEPFDSVNADDLLAARRRIGTRCCSTRSASSTSRSPLWVRQAQINPIPGLDRSGLDGLPARPEARMALQWNMDHGYLVRRHSEYHSRWRAGRAERGAKHGVGRPPTRLAGGLVRPEPGPDPVRPAGERGFGLFLGREALHRLSRSTLSRRRSSSSTRAGA